MSFVLTSDGRFYRHQPNTSTSVTYPYRAIVGGEEHAIKGWRGGHLVTDKGEFTFQRLQGKDVDSEWRGEIGRILPNCNCRSAILLEVATLRMGEEGEWLLNDRKLETLLLLPAGSRLFRLRQSEVLRLRKREICAVAWFQVLSGGSKTVELDLALTDWTGKSTPRVPFSPSLLFAGWSRPVWLASFQKVGEPMQSQAKPHERKQVPRFERDYGEAVVFDEAGNEQRLTIEQELQKLIKRIVNAGGTIPRTILRQGKSDSYQPEKLFQSKVAKALFKAELLGKSRTGRTVVYWVKH